MCNGQQIFKDAAKYQGEYVALSSPSSDEVICHGENAEQVLDEVTAKGYTGLTIIYVPKKNMGFVL